MLPRRALSPETHWPVGQPINMSQGLATAPFVFVSGQLDLDAAGALRNAGDLQAQARGCMAYVEAVLAAAGAELADLVMLKGFYVNDGSADESALLAELAACLGTLDRPLGRPGPAVSLIPIEVLSVPGLMIEIEAIAMRDPNGPPLARSAAWAPDCPALPAPFSQALRCREMLFVSGITAQDGAGRIAAPGDLTAQSGLVLPKIDRLLRQLGADLGDAVKTNVFNVEGGSAEDWSAPALTRAGFFPEPGPCATGIPLPRLWPEGLMVKNDLIAMRAPDGSRIARRHVWPAGHWDWPVHLPYRHGLQCGELVFMGGQVSLAPDGAVIDPGEMGPQTERSMDFIERVLAGFGLEMRHVVKMNTFYSGTGGEDAHAENLLRRFARFTEKPGPVSTGVPLPYLAYKDMVIEIDVIAVS